MFLTEASASFKSYNTYQLTNTRKSFSFLAFHCTPVSPYLQVCPSLVAVLSNPYTNSSN
jgi:hypothetical protein